MTIRDITHYHGLIEGHASLMLGAENLRNSWKIITMHEQELDKLSGLEKMLERLQATLISFSKEDDVQQTADLLRQSVNENLQEPGKCCASKHADTIVDGKGLYSIEVKSCIDSL